MISKTDCTPYIYSSGNILVKPYKEKPPEGRAPARARARIRAVLPPLPSSAQTSPIQGNFGASSGTGVTSFQTPVPASVSAKSPCTIQSAMFEPFEGRAARDSVEVLTLGYFDSTTCVARSLEACSVHR